ncbi:hypothetical protein Tco_1440165 [Tanacetum coccineum]
MSLTKSLSLFDQIFISCYHLGTNSHNDDFSPFVSILFHFSVFLINSEDGIFISQDKYVAEILKKFDFVNVKTASTPIETQKPLVKDNEASDVYVHLYRSMIGSLMYLNASRPDIMFVVCACSRFQVTPKSTHLSTEDIIDVGDSNKEDDSTQDCFVLPIWPSYSSTNTLALTTDDKREGPREEEQVFMIPWKDLKARKGANEEAEALKKKFEHLVIKEGAAKPSSTNIFSTVNTPAKASSTNLVNTVSLLVSTASPYEGISLFDPTNPEED